MDRLNISAYTQLNTNMEDETLERRKMIHEQLERRGIHDQRILSAFHTVPRHLFVPPEYRKDAYADTPLPIGHHQTISQPYIVALMTSLLELKGQERVLEIGTGSGYQAAILSKLTSEVHTVEIIPELYEAAKLLLFESGYSNIHCHLADGSIGWIQSEPYGGIILTAAAPNAPKELFDQLLDGGKMVLPVGGGDFQELQIWYKENGELKIRRGIGVSFVPLRGERGWK